jgi:hypothetical protein
VQQDHRVSAPAFALAFVISQHINATTGRAWPTQETLANAVRVNPRHVRRLALELEKAGHLSIESGGGRRISNIYRLLRIDEPAEGENADTESRVIDLQTRTQRAGLPRRNPDISSTKPGSTEPKTRLPIAGRTSLMNQPQEPLPVFLQKQAAPAAEFSALDEDPKAVLFREGLTWLAGSTGKPATSMRSSLGQMLKLARDDAGAVLALLRDARREKRAEPVAWIMGALRARNGGGVGAAGRTALQLGGRRYANDV